MDDVEEVVVEEEEVAADGADVGAVPAAVSACFNRSLALWNSGMVTIKSFYLVAFL